MDRVRVAMLSFWHVHAPGYAADVQKQPDAEISVVWDEDENRGRMWAEKLGVPFEPDLEAALSRDDVDGVVVDAPTNLHTEVILAAARAQKHIFTEKVVALTVAEVDQITAAVNEAGVEFVVSFPFRGQPRFRFAKQVVDEGLLGDITTIRVRHGHGGVLDGWLPPHFLDPVPTGGGAMIDLGCHPMYLARWYGGEPARVTAILGRFNKDLRVDDNSAVLIEFKNGALGIVEASFVQRSLPWALEIHGTAGALHIGGPGFDVQLHSEKATGLSGWISPDKLPEPDPSPLRQWLDAILKKARPKITLQDGRDLTELMEATTRSWETGRSVELPLA